MFLFEKLNQSSSKDVLFYLQRHLMCTNVKEEADTRRVLLLCCFSGAWCCTGGCCPGGGCVPGGAGVSSPFTKYWLPRHPCEFTFLSTSNNVLQGTVQPFSSLVFMMPVGRARGGQGHFVFGLRCKCPKTFQYRRIAFPGPAFMHLIYKRNIKRTSTSRLSI